MRRTDFRAPALVLVSMVALQIGGALAVTLFDRLNPATVTLLRVGIAAVILWVFTRPRPWQWNRQRLLVTVLYGVSLIGMNLCFYEAINLIPLGVAVTIEFIGPLGVALLGARGATDALSAVLAAIGVVLLGWPSNGQIGFDPRGMLLAFVAGLFWAAYILVASRVGGADPGLGGLAVALAVATGIACIFGGSGLSTLRADPMLLAWAGVVAVLSSVVPYSLELAALRTMPPRVMGVLVSIEPAIASVAGFLILSQVLQLREIVAVVLVVCASAMATLFAAPESPPIDSPRSDQHGRTPATSDRDA